MRASEARVIVDNRERNSEILEALRAKGVALELRQVPVGDYVLSDRVCIERKTIQDFESSLMNGRLFDQIKRLKEHYEFPILLLEGDSDYFRLKSNVINGAMAALYIEYGIVVICTNGPQNTAEVIANLARHEQSDELREPSLKGGARAHTGRQFQEYIIGNLPGVGPKLARSLLVHFKNIRSIANAEPGELRKVEKIGRKKAEMIHDILNRIYDQ